MIRATLWDRIARRWLRPLGDTLFAVGLQRWHLPNSTEASPLSSPLLRGVKSGRKTHRSRWSLLSLLGVVLVLGTRPAGPFVTVVHRTRSTPLAPTPVQWITAHGTWTNDAIDVPQPGILGPAYRLRTPWLMSSSPVVAQGRIFVTTTALNHRTNPPGAILAVQARTGRVLWRNTTANALDSQPIVAQGRVIVGIGNAVFRSRAPFPLPATLPGTQRGTGPSAIVALSVSTGRVLWRIPTQGSDQPTGTIYDGTLYTATGSGAFLAINPTTGHVRWRLALGMFVSRSSPRIDHMIAYLGGGGPEQVLAINLRTHRLIWRTRFPHAVGGLDDTPLAMAHHLLIGEAMLGNPHQSRWVPSHTQVVFALNATTGQRVWQTPLASGIEPRYKQGATPTIAGSTVYVGTAVTSGLWALNLFTGHLRWSLASNSPITRPPLVWPHHVLAVTTTGTLLETTPSGYPVQPQSLASWVTTFAPLLIHHTIFVTGNTRTHGFLQVRPWQRSYRVSRLAIDS